MLIDVFIMELVLNKNGGKNGTAENDLRKK